MESSFFYIVINSNMSSNDSEVKVVAHGQLPKRRDSLHFDAEGVRQQAQASLVLLELGRVNAPNPIRVEQKKSISATSLKCEIIVVEVTLST